jgi:hypothetical protein
LQVVRKLTCIKTRGSPGKGDFNDSNFHQTWPPVLLKIESLTKKSIKKNFKVPIASKLWVWLIPFYILHFFIKCSIFSNGGGHV